MANQPIYEMTDTWSQAGTKHHAIKMNVTDAASTPDSALIELLVGGNAKITGVKDGSLILAGTLRTIQAALASLPSASAQGAGAIAYATDIGSVVSDGASWLPIGGAAKAAPVNLNDAKEEGTYFFTAEINYTNAPQTNQAITSSGTDGHTMRVSRVAVPNGGTDKVLQILTASGIFGGIWVRIYFNDLGTMRWSTWVQLAFRPASIAEMREAIATDKAVTPSALRQIMAFSALAASATTTLNFNNVNPNVALTLSLNATLAAPTGLIAGQSGTIRIAQDSTGGRTLGFNSFWNFGAAGPPTIPTAANAVCYVFYQIDSDSSRAMCTYRSQ